VALVSVRDTVCFSFMSVILIQQLPGSYSDLCVIVFFFVQYSAFVKGAVTLLKV